MTEDEFAGLFEVTGDKRASLFTNENLALVARLKAANLARYMALLDQLQANGVKKLRVLETAVDRLLRDARKRQAAKTRKQPGDFERDDKGTVLATQDNVRLAITKLDLTLRYDTFAGMPIVEGMEDFGPAIDDHAMNRMWLTIDEQFGFRPSLPFFQTVIIDACLRNRFHPVCDYLDNLTWDGKSRLDTWLHTYCGVDDSPFTRAVGAIQMIAAVRRVRKPGSKHDEMLIFEGPEGGQKSTLLRELAVKEDWFTDSLPLNVDDKRMIEAASGKWIVEVSELQGMRKGDVGRIKAQLSRARDRARLAYYRLPVEVPRQCVFFGTVNPEEASGYLASLTGNRRFWPVEVGHIALEAFRRDLDQLWAEAEAREAKGESTVLDSSLWSVAAEQQREREAPNPIRDALAPYLSKREGVIFTEELWTIANVPLAQRSQFYAKLGKAMKDMGWESSKERRQPGAERERCYIRGDTSKRITARRDQGHLSIGHIDRNKESAAIEAVTEALTEFYGE